LSHFVHSEWAVPTTALSVDLYAFMHASQLKRNQMSITQNTAVKKSCREEWRTFIRPNILLIQVVWLLHVFT